MTTPNNATHGAASAAFSFSTTPSNTMNYQTHNQANIEYNFTSLQGYVDADYKELVDLFGKPTKGDAYKVDAEWVLKFDDSTVATIYNYKNGKNYNGDEGLAVEQIRDWHIGGHDKQVVNRVQIILDLHREGKPEQKDKVEEAFDDAHSIMDTLRKVKGAEYARTVESGLITRKLIEMFHLTLSAAVSSDGIPEEAADLLNHLFSSMCAKQLSLCARNGGVTQGGEVDAKELMGWVDKLMDKEQSIGVAVMKAATKGDRNDD